MKLAFMHIPKTGGIALERAIEESRDGQLNICDVYKPPEYEGKLYKDIEGFDFYKGHFRIDFVRSLPKDYKKITVVRPPEDLLLSLYNHIASRPAHSLHETAADVSFGEFVEQTAGIHNVLTKYLLGWADYAAICLDQSKTLDERFKVMLPMIKENLSLFDAIGVTSHLALFSQEVASVLGTGLPEPKRENTNPSTRISRKDLTEEEITAIRKATWADRPVFRMIWDQYLAPKYTTASD